MPSIHAISDLRNYTRVLRQVGRGQPVFLTKNGRGRFVLQDIADYEERQAVRRFGPYEKGSVTLDEVFGCLHRPGQPTLSIEEMDEAIGRAVCERHEIYKAPKTRKKPSP
ncbi:MAG: type II toxin-antitoxin system prevent-host-death family antitoxin [Opitutae bacterium]|jgi:prevent-host-death family protein|nr:type II toxin-antitoxin system prevent-host-death family antitoxin [Opitutae bacterium]